MISRSTNFFGSGQRLLYNRAMRTLAVIVAVASVSNSWGVEDYTFFEKEIRPILVEHCYECHSQDAKRVKGNLYLDNKAGWKTGGDSGAVIVPGAPEESLAFEALTYKNLNLQMPPKGKLPARKIAAIKKWIEDGAPDPRESGALAVKDEGPSKEWWSFKPVTNPNIPEVKQADWPRDHIDRFILAGLERIGVEAPKATGREALIRRIHFDLTGLPPTAEQVRSFCRDGDLESVIDELLASPRFGERWGRHWMDVARYAESSGGGRSIIFKEAWRYRDYVIKSFNQDKPYDRFVREQLAGDLLADDDPEIRADNLIATGFLLLAPTNFENQDKELLDLEVVDEQLDTLGQTFMGMTLGCARCHDHKFDPVTAEDYYAMAGIFFSTDCLEHANVSSVLQQKLPASADLEAKIAAHDKQGKALEAKRKSLSDQIKKMESALKSNVRPLTDIPGGILVDNVDAKVPENWVHSTHTRPWIGSDYLHDNYGKGGESEVTFPVHVPDEGEYEVFVSYSANANRSPNALVRVKHASGVAEIRVDQRKKPDRFDAFVSLGKFQFGSGKQDAVTVSNQGSSGVVIADAVLLVGDIEVESVVQSDEAPDHDEGAKKRARKLAALKKQVGDLTKSIKAHNSNSTLKRQTTMAVRDAKKPANTALRIRGEVHKKGDIIPRGFLSVASWDGMPEISEGSGRLELAEWLVDPRHPLTARVMVNRLWYHLMGEGLVRTVDNFGSMGELPSHPELLDYLAVEFVKDDWSIKRMIRRLMLTRTYAISAEGSSVGAEQDPDNFLLWRAHRRRLESEAMRDAMLAISGELEMSKGGRTFPGNLGSVFGYTFDHKLRSVYLPVFRNNLPDIFDVFDFADANRVAGKRSSSTLPTQALYMMNSPFVIERARQAADRLVNDSTYADPLNEVFLQTVGREPMPSERVDIEKFLGKDPEVEAWASVYHSLFASLDFRYLH